jgi:hypothetical protein
MARIGGSVTIYRKSEIDVIGPIWMPADTAATTYNVSGYDIENMRDESGQITRESVALWLDSHAGDFQSVTDFHASLDDSDISVDIPWEHEESEYTFNDLTYPEAY